MELSVKIFFSGLFLLSVTLPTLVRSNDDGGWAWGGADDDTLTPDPPTPRPKTGRPTVPPTDATRTPPTAPSNARFNNCLRDCPRVTSYNPVCGTDNVTYKNEAMLKCATRCGKEVQSMHEGRCAPPPEPTQTRPTTLTPSSRVENCIKGCPKLPQYNPVCGTDGVSYNNDALLSCAKNCGKSVDIVYRGNCAAPPVPDESSSITPPTPTPPRFPPTTPGPSDLDDIVFRECVQECPNTLESLPVCGSDGVTYANKAVFNCQVKCGKRIEIASNGKCPAAGGGSSSSRPNPRVEACMKKCPNLPQYNPVCGTNNQTYKNEGLMKCAQHCGVDVKISSRGSCPS